MALWKQGAPGFEAIETNPQGAFPILVSNLLPVGLKGLVLAGMLSALMSSLASLFNSTATLFTVDFYKRLRPQSSEKHLVNVGRLATAGVIVLGMAWIPFLQDLGKGQLYTYLQLVQSLLAPSIAAVFMAGIFFDTVTPKSGLIGISTGFVLGMARLILQAAHEMYGIQWPGLIQDFVDLNWLYFSFLLFVFTCVLIFIVSAVTPNAPPEKLAGLTYGTVTRAQVTTNNRKLKYSQLMSTKAWISPGHSMPWVSCMACSTSRVMPITKPLTMPTRPDLGVTPLEKMPSMKTAAMDGASSDCTSCR